MDEFTYQAQDTKCQLETYEWDRTWMQNAMDDTKKRVLYIGDSISVNIRPTVNALANEAFLFDGFGSSKGIDNPYLKDSIILFAKQLVRCDYVLFNNGLHGWHLEDEGEYKSYYEDMVKSLKAFFGEIPFLIVLTTYVSNQTRNQRVLLRNKVAKEIAEKYGLPVIDLYSVSEEHKELLKDGVHYDKEADRAFASVILDALNSCK